MNANSKARRAFSKAPTSLPTVNHPLHPWKGAPWLSPGWSAAATRPACSMKDPFHMPSSTPGPCLTQEGRASFSVFSQEILVFFSPVLLRYNWYITQFDVCIYCKAMITIGLVNIHHLTYLPFFSRAKNFQDLFSQQLSNI